MFNGIADPLGEVANHCFLANMDLTTGAAGGDRNVARDIFTLCFGDRFITTVPANLDKFDVI